MTQDNTPKIQDYSAELEVNIFTLVMTLITHKSNFVGYAKASQIVAAHLEKLAAALKETQ